MSARGACLLVPPDVPLPHSFKMEVDQTWRVAQRGMAALVACRRAIPEITGKKSAGSRFQRKNLATRQASFLRIPVHLGAGHEQARPA
jgi:hypothetical protein